jgi:hypothetical protein
MALSSMRWNIPQIPILHKFLFVPYIVNGKFIFRTTGRCTKGCGKAFGELFKKWAIIYRPSRLWHVEDMDIVMMACIILHNMSCEEMRETFAGSSAARMQLDINELEEEKDNPIILPPEALENPGEAPRYKLLLEYKLLLYPLARVGQC